MGPLDPERRMDMPCVFTIQDELTKRWHLGFVKAGDRLKDVELFRENNWATQQEASDALLDALVAIELTPSRKPH